MTSPHDADRLIELVDRARVLLLDFDGPICRLFAGHPAPAIAARVRDVIAAHGATLPDCVPADAGPDALLRHIADLDDAELTRRVADQVRDAEIEAAATASPTPGAEDVLDAAQATGRAVAVVSNNAAHAVRAYLDGHGLRRYVAHVVARNDGMSPLLLKPDPHLLRLALDHVAAQPDAALFVGDSISDIHAAKATGVPVIGYANKPGKHQAMTDAHADTVINTMTQLNDALRT